jgi:hypothetical protein
MKRFRLRALVFVSSVGMLLSVFCVEVPRATAGTVAAPTITHRARISVAPNARGARGVRSTWTSENWSGYAETGTFTGVTGTWTVPAVAPTSSSTYSSTWIGVDGLSNQDLIQTGTEADYYSGATHYGAWWEILPASETVISPRTDLVEPGDQMSASIYETSTTTTSRGRRSRSTTQHLWSIAIKDSTRGWSFATSQPYNGPGASAEWITEAPEVNGRIASLSHYTFSPPTNTGDFDNAGFLTSVVSSGSPSYTNAGLNYQNDSGVMIQNGAQVSTPGDPDGALTAFNVAYGSSLPTTPTG